MKGAPPTKADDLDTIQAILDVVDRRGRDMDERWGIGRLPSLVPIEWAQRFASQKRKFSDAVWSWKAQDAQTHGEAMLRAYAKLDELAVEAGHQPTPPEQWEFMSGDSLVILVRDRKQMNQVQTGGRRCQIWSLDEVEEVIRKHPMLALAKDEFQGAEIVNIRPVRDIQDQLNDSLEGLPI